MLARSEKKIPDKMSMQKYPNIFMALQTGKLLAVAKAILSWQSRTEVNVYLGLLLVVRLTLRSSKPVRKFAVMCV